MRADKKESHQVAIGYGLEIKGYLPNAIELKKRLKNLEDYGFSKPEIIGMVRRSPTIIGFTAERTNKSLQNLEDYGFSKPEIIGMVRRSPTIIEFTAERTNGLLQNLENYGFTKEEIREMVRKLPPILGYTAERTGKLIKWFRFHRIEINLVKKPFCLIFSLKTLEARRKELEKIGFDYQKKPYPLFWSKREWEEFIAKFGLKF